MGPLAYYIIGAIPSIYRLGKLPDRNDPLMFGYKLTWIPSLPLLVWQFVVYMTPDSWIKMDTYFDISLFGPWWLWLFAPFYDTIQYLIVYTDREYLLLITPYLAMQNYLKTIVTMMSLVFSIFLYRGA